MEVHPPPPHPAPVVTVAEKTTTVEGPVEEKYTSKYPIRTTSTEATTAVPPPPPGVPTTVVGEEPLLSKTVETSGFVPPEEKVLVLKNGESTRIQLKSYSKDVNALFSTVETVTKDKTAPTNDKLTYLLGSAEGEIEVQREKARLHKSTNKTGNLLLDDIGQILQDTKTFIIEKNFADRLHQIVEYAKLAAQEETEGLSVNRTAVQKEGKVFKKESTGLAKSVRRLLLLLIGSREFRALLVEAIDILQIFFKYTAQSGSADQIANSLKQDVSGTTATQTLTNAKETTKQVLKVAKDDFKDGLVVSEEKKREAIERLRVFLVKLGASKEYSRAVKDLFKVLHHMQTLHEKAMKDRNVTHSNAQKMWDQIVLLIQDVAGGYSLENSIKYGKEVYRIVERDPEVKQWTVDLRVFVLKTLKKPQEFEKDSYYEEGNRLIDRGIALLKRDTSKESDLRRTLDSLLEELKALFRSMKEDKTNKQIRNDWEKLGQDLVFNSTGQPSLTKLRDSLKEIKDMFLPILQQETHHVSIPRVEGFTKSIDFAVEGLMLNLNELLPEMVHLKLVCDMDLQFKQMDVNDFNVTITMDVKDMNQSAKGVKFEFKRHKSGYSDEGAVDIDCFHTDVTIMWKAVFSEDRWQFSVDKTICHIGKLKIHIVYAKHNILDKIGVSLFGPSIKSAIVKAIQEKFSEAANNLCAKLERVANQKTTTTSNKPSSRTASRKSLLQTTQSSSTAVKSAD